MQVGNNPSQKTSAFVDLSMMRLSIAALLFLPVAVWSQDFTASRIFAHNDYVREDAFYAAYELGVGYIEADVFLRDGDLMVAHHEHEIRKGRTLEKMYLIPLERKIRGNRGSVFPYPDQSLTLMVDLKTEGYSTMQELVRQLEKHSSLLSCLTLRVMVSGDVPPPDRWGDFPAFITFDGRPGISYTDEQLARIGMISSGFRQHIQWDGRQELSASDRARILELIAAAHEKGKTFRFWATPDFPQAWQILLDLNFDVIVTDDVLSLARYIAK